MSRTSVIWKKWGWVVEGWDSWFPYSADSLWLGFVSWVFHDKYQWEIWKNTAGKSSTTDPCICSSFEHSKVPKTYHFMIRLQMKINCFPKPGKDVLDAPKLNFKRKTLITEGLMIDIRHYDPNHMRVRRQSQGPFWIWASLHLLPNFPSSPPQVLVPSSSTREPTRI